MATPEANIQWWIKLFNGVLAVFIGAVFLVDFVYSPFDKYTGTYASSVQDLYSAITMATCAGMCITLTWQEFTIFDYYRCLLFITTGVVCIVILVTIKFPEQFSMVWVFIHQCQLMICCYIWCLRPSMILPMHHPLPPLITLLLFCTSELLGASSHIDPISDLVEQYHLPGRLRGMAFSLYALNCATSWVGLMTPKWNDAIQQADELEMDFDNEVQQEQAKLFNHTDSNTFARTMQSLSTSVVKWLRDWKLLLELSPSEVEFRGLIMFFSHTSTMLVIYILPEVFNSPTWETRPVPYLVLYYLMFMGLMFLVIYSKQTLIKNQAMLVSTNLAARRHLIKHVSHEMRTPLNIITMGLDLLHRLVDQSTAVEDDKYESENIIGELRNSCELATHIIEDLVSFEDTENENNITGDLVAVNAASFLDKAIGAMNMDPLACAQRVTFNKMFKMGGHMEGVSEYVAPTSPEEWVPCVTVNRRHFWKVLRCVLHNAVKYSKENGVVLLNASIVNSSSTPRTPGSPGNPSPGNPSSTKADDGAVNVSPDKLRGSPGGAPNSCSSTSHSSASKQSLVIKVTDYGVGISQSALSILSKLLSDKTNLSKLPANFNCASGSAGAKAGLVTARNIIHTYGGTISVVSKGVGFGATVRIELPLQWQKNPDAGKEKKDGRDESERFLVLVTPLGSQRSSVPKSGGAGRSRSNTGSEPNSVRSSAGGGASNLDSAPISAGVPMPTAAAKPTLANEANARATLSTVTAEEKEKRNQRRESKTKTEKQRIVDDCRELDFECSWNVLVVDDSLVNRKMEARLMRNMKHNVFEADDGDTCVEFMTGPKGADIDVVLLDNTMPRMKGRDAVRIMRKKGIEIPVIGITGDGLTDLVNDFRDQGADVVLCKGDVGYRLILETVQRSVEAGRVWKHFKSDKVEEEGEGDAGASGANSDTKSTTVVSGNSSSSSGSSSAAGAAHALTGAASAAADVLQNPSDNAADPGSQVPASTKSSLTISTEKPWCVLVVDDAMSQRKYLRRMLASEGHSCVEADDGDTCLQMVEGSDDHPFDVILLDNFMSRVAGPETAKQLRSQCCDIPIIGVTAGDDEVERENFLRSGADVVLKKPITNADVQQAVRNILAERARRNSGQPASTTRWKVLVVEDSNVCRKNISRILKSRGHQVVEATDGAHCTELMSSGSDLIDAGAGEGPDLACGSESDESNKNVSRSSTLRRKPSGGIDVILMDNLMPRKTGAEATQEIRKKGYSSIPIVGITEYNDEEDLQAFASSGVDSVIKKPMTFEDIAAAVNDATTKINNRNNSAGASKASAGNPAT